MNKIKLIAVLFVSMFVWAGTANAGTCEVQYDRTSCPGKEAISYKKCKGEKTCSKFKEASDAEACKAKAVKSCANRRLNITKSKVIKAIYEGQALKNSKGGDDFCQDYAKASEEFNKCDA